MQRYVLYSGQTRESISVIYLFYFTIFHRGIVHKFIIESEANVLAA